MTEQELKEYRVIPPFELPGKQEHLSDEYGVYATGTFMYKGNSIVITNDGMWHLSIVSDHVLSYKELKEIRYKFMPDEMLVAQIFPSREEAAESDHPLCFSLYQLYEDF